MDASLFHLMFVIFTGSAVLATVALYARQAMLLAYILLGMILGPGGVGALQNIDIAKDAAHIGIVFLLFLLGLNLQPRSLIDMLAKTTLLTLLSSLIFGLIGMLVAWSFSFTLWESIIIGIAMTFSSTIIGLKLLPTTVLHHRHAGEIIISVLLLQDLVAIFVLLVIQGAGSKGDSSLWLSLLTTVIGLPTLLGFAWLFSRYILFKLIRRFDKIQEYIFLMTIGWCLGMAELSSLMGLSEEIGAFIAGVMLASSPISLFIAESLKPVRDFFLVLFFFSLGASLDLSVANELLFPALLLGGLMLLSKPFVFKLLLVRMGEKPGLSMEMGVRLGQISEFSLLIAVLAMDLEVISARASYLIQLATLISFAASSYYIVMTYPTPIAVSDKLRRD